MRPTIVTLPGRHHAVIASGGIESGDIACSQPQQRPTGIAFIPDLSNRAAAPCTGAPNWGYDVSRSQPRFARRLIAARVNPVHEHSSQHQRPIKAYRDKLILYCCEGDRRARLGRVRPWLAYRPIGQKRREPLWITRFRDRDVIRSTSRAIGPIVAPYRQQMLSIRNYAAYSLCGTVSVTRRALPRTASPCGMRKVKSLGETFGTAFAACSHRSSRG